MSNRAMEIVEKLRSESRVSKSEISGGSPNRYYEHMSASDIKVSVFAEYLKAMGYKIVIVKEGVEF